MRYFIIRAAQCMEIKPEETPEFSGIDEANRHFVDYDPWEQYVLSVVKQFEEAGVSAVSYSLLHRYCVDFWRAYEWSLHMRLLAFMLSFGRTPLEYRLAYHVTLWLSGGHRLAHIYKMLDAGIESLLRKCLLEHIEVEAPRGTVHLYALSPWSRSRF